MTLDETTDFTNGDRVFTVKIPHKELGLIEQALNADDWKLAVQAMRNSTKLSAKLALLTIIAEVFEGLEARRSKQADGDNWFEGN